MKNNKKMIALAMTACLMVSSAALASAEGLKNGYQQGMKNGMTAGYVNGMTAGSVKG